MAHEARAAWPHSALGVTIGVTRPGDGWGGSRPLLAQDPTARSRSSRHRLTCHPARVQPPTPSAHRAGQAWLQALPTGRWGPALWQGCSAVVLPHAALW